jgi:hypothetical protein
MLATYANSTDEYASPSSTRAGSRYSWDAVPTRTALEGSFARFEASFARFEGGEHADDLVADVESALAAAVE